MNQLKNRQKNSTPKNFWQYIPFFGAAATTLFVAPYSNYDPINLPKALLLSVVGCLLSIYFLFVRNVKLAPRDINLLVGVFGLSFLFSFHFNDNDRIQQLLGVYGRSTGFFSLSCLFIILVFSAYFARVSSEFVPRAIQWFCKTSYIVTAYMVIQFADIDPIPWSQKLPVATLGNINFASSLLGMASSIFICRLIIPRATMSERIFFLSVICLNVALIMATGSIQGLLCIFASMFVILLSRAWQKIWLLAKVPIISLSASFAVIVLSGSMGVGPFGNYIKQETAVYRLDYWLAGIRMIESSPFVGLGLDSYGDYYRNFRTPEATIRTGPQRVSNTAHNILIDWGVGVGLLFVILFCILLSRYIWISFSTNSNLNGIQRSENEQLLAVIIAWCVFLLISINQLGVTVWGFLFFGCLVGKVFETNVKTSSLSKAKHIGSLQPKRSFTLKIRKVIDFFASRILFIQALGKFVLVMFFVSIVVLYSIAFRADIRFLESLKSGKNVIVQDLPQSFINPSYYYEQAALNSRKLGDESAAVEVSIDAIKRFPRSYTNWAILATSPATPAATRKEAIVRLFELDPNNPDLKKEFQTKD